MLRVWKNKTNKITDFGGGSWDGWLPISWELQAIGEYEWQADVHCGVLRGAFCPLDFFRVDNQITDILFFLLVSISLFPKPFNTKLEIKTRFVEHMLTTMTLTQWRVKTFLSAMMISFSLLLTFFATCKLCCTESMSRSLRTNFLLRSLHILYLHAFAGLIAALLLRH